MALERRNPLPVGVYWIDIFEADMGPFRDWIAKNKGTVRVISTESFEESSWHDFGSYPARDWYLFEVTSPVAWEGPGFPTIAKSKTLTASDTSQRPPPPKGPVEQLEEAAGAAKTGGAIIIGGALVLGGLLFWNATRK
jgi:hypothetical protein